MITQFFHLLLHYLIEIIPALAVGFLISGLVHEFIPNTLIEKYLGEKGIGPILYATVIGTILPVCCFGSLPIAVSFYKKGARLGPVLAFLVATPATSISALLVTWKLLGIGFTVFIFFAVIIIGLIMGVMGNMIKFKPKPKNEEVCPHCKKAEVDHKCEITISGKIQSIFKFAFITMPKELGFELLIGIVLAALVGAVVPIGRLIHLYLSGSFGYIFSLVFGLIMYICSTATVPLVDAFIKQGMSAGAGMVLLLAGPVTSMGALLVLRKEFGVKILMTYLGIISIFSLLFGYCFSLIS